MPPMGLGNDRGGSLRTPSFCNGTTAIKPTQGRAPEASSIPPLDPMFAAQLMATDGPMARSVRDLRLGMEILNGRDARDPGSVDVALDGARPAGARPAPRPPPPTPPPFSRPRPPAPRRRGGARAEGGGATPPPPPTPSPSP